MIHKSVLILLATLSKFHFWEIMQSFPQFALSFKWFLLFPFLTLFRVCICYITFLVISLNYRANCGLTWFKSLCFVHEHSHGSLAWFGIYILLFLRLRFSLICCLPHQQEIALSKLWFFTSCCFASPHRIVCSISNLNASVVGYLV